MSLVYTENYFYLDDNFLLAYGVCNMLLFVMDISLYDLTAFLL